MGKVVSGTACYQRRGGREVTTPELSSAAAAGSERLRRCTVAPAQRECTLLLLMFPGTATLAQQGGETKCHLMQQKHQVQAKATPDALHRGWLHLTMKEEW